MGVVAGDHGDDLVQEAKAVVVDQQAVAGDLDVAIRDVDTRDVGRAVDESVKDALNMEDGNRNNRNNIENNIGNNRE